MLITYSSSLMMLSENAHKVRFNSLIIFITDHLIDYERPENFTFYLF